MSIKGNEKVKVQKTIEDLSMGNFDERDIDYLFISLRAYSGNYKIFKEVSHFVAHNDLRNQGVTNESLEAFYLSFKYFSEYITDQRTLDIGVPFPSYIIKLMKYQIDKCKEDDLRKFNVTKNRFKSRLDKYFKINKKNKTALLSKRLSELNYSAINHILGFIGSHPAYTQQEIITEIVQVLHLNKMTFNEQDILNQSDRIMLCVLPLIHNTKYDFKGHKNGTCSIGCEKNSIPFDMTFINENGVLVEIKESFGNLQINGTVPTINKEHEIMVSFPVITTNLDVEKWCDNSLFTIDEREGRYKLKVVNFDGSVGINQKFNLIKQNA